MKDCTNLVDLVRETVPDVPRDFSNLIVNAVATATSNVSSAIRNYGSVYGQNQMLEYSTDGKISDVTSTFSGRTAISDSVLANLSSELTTLKQNYDKAWSLLPTKTDTVPITVTDELSASFSVESSTTGPQSEYITTWAGLGSDRVCDVSNRQGGHVVSIIYGFTSQGATMRFGNVHEDQSVGDMIARLPGTIILDSNIESFTSFTMLKDPNSTASVFIISVLGRISFICVYDRGYMLYTGATSDVYLSSLTSTITKVSDSLAPVTSSYTTPGVIRDANIKVSDVQFLSYSTTDGPSQIDVSKSVSSTVEYEYTYNVLPNESAKIQALIDAIP